MLQVVIMSIWKHKKPYFVHTIERIALQAQSLCDFVTTGCASNVQGFHQTSLFWSVLKKIQLVLVVDSPVQLD